MSSGKVHRTSFIRSILASAIIAFTPIFSTPSLAQGYGSSLPEPRYQEKERGEVRILNQKYQYIVLEDRWKQELERKVKELDDSNKGYDMDSCLRLTVSESGLHCEQPEKYCAEYRFESKEVKDLDCLARKDYPCYPKTESQEVCVSEATKDAGFHANYTEMQTIRRSDGFFNDDNVIIGTARGEYEVDFGSKEQASAFATRLDEIKQIAMRVFQDSSSSRLKEEAEHLQELRREAWSNLSYHQKMVHMALKCSVSAMDDYIYSRATKSESISVALGCIERYSKGKKIFNDLLHEAEEHIGKNEFGRNGLNELMRNQSQYQDISAKVLGFLQEEVKLRYFPPSQEAKEMIKALQTALF